MEVDINILMDIKKEFKINEYISLKLEDRKTNIYVGGIKFLHCMELVLNIPVNQIKSYDEINSIDEAEDLYKELLRDNNIYEKGIVYPIKKAIEYNLTPEQEFWGHSSNIQVWCENNYNTNLLHSNLAFPLLKRLRK